MKYEKLRLATAQMLLDRRKIARFAVGFPRALKVLQVVLWLSCFTATEKANRLMYNPLFSVVLSVASILLFLLTACFELLRNRWLCSNTFGEQLSFVSLLVDFSFSDFLKAVELYAFSRLRCAARIAAFSALPLVACVYFFELSGLRLSQLKWFVLTAGCVLLLAAAAVFAAAAVSSVTTAGKFCCFEAQKPLRSFVRKTAFFDTCSLRLLKFKLTFLPYGGSFKAVADLVQARTLLKSNESNNSSGNSTKC